MLQNVPELTSPDDTVLLADNARDIKRLAIINGNASTNIGLRFSTGKPGIMILN